MKINSLRVISRSSMMTYKDAPKPLKDIARELDVDVLVEGVFHRLDDKIKITIKLIQPEPEDHLWGNEYEETIDEIPILQGKIAQTIASKLDIKLTRQEENRFRNIQQVNPDAYDRYLLARYHYNNYKFLLAKEEFEKAIIFDPNFAAAYSGLAMSYTGAAHFGYLLPKDVLNNAKRFSTKALSIDSTSIEAHVALGETFLAHWDIASAEKYLKRAVELNPNNDLASNKYSYLLCILGKFDEGIELRRQGIIRDPFSLRANFGLGWAYYYSRSYNKAAIQLKKTLEVDPTNLYTNSYLALSYSHMGKYSKALSIVKEQKLYERQYPARDIASLIYAKAGLIDEAGKLLESMNDPIETSFKALTYANLGEIDKAFEWLEITYKTHSSNMSCINIDPDFDPIRNDPRFQDLLKRAGFTDNKME
jgi:Tfp pilus assembly protein PilF